MSKTKKRRALKFRLLMILLVAVFGFLAFRTRPSIDIGGEYTDKKEVALYIMEYNQLPKNYITKADIGTAPSYVDLSEKIIGGDTFWNKENNPELVGYLKECDVKTDNYDPLENRGKERLVYTVNTKDVRVFYTADHYDTFEEITLDDIYRVSSVCTVLFFVSAGGTVLVFIFTHKKKHIAKVPSTKAEKKEDAPL
ncbi:MAG: hypothetical protein J6K61_00195 [Clostridia bacterium]|nr:hypothetical protein [Clostridia bacterium]